MRYLLQAVDRATGEIGVLLSRHDGRANDFEAKLRELVWLLQDLKALGSQSQRLERVADVCFERTYQAAASVAKQAALRRWHVAGDLSIEVISQVTAF